MFDFSKPREFGPVTVQGRKLECVICRHAIFWEHRIQLSTPILAFLDNESVAHCAVCERCGYVHMFIPPNTVRADDPAPEAPNAAAA